MKKIMKKKIEQNPIRWFPSQRALPKNKVKVKALAEVVFEKRVKHSLKNSEGD